MQFGNLWRRAAAAVRGQYCAAVVPAAGSSSRMGENKLLLDLLGKPVLVRTLEALASCSLVDEIVVVCREEDRERVEEYCRLCVAGKPWRAVRGGESRLESVSLGLQAVDKRATLVAVHDAARPLVSQRILAETIERAAAFHAAAPGVAVKDTIKRVEGGVAMETVDRDTLVAIQTPQVFEATLLRGAIQNALQRGENCTDECAALEAIGMKTVVTQGDYRNLKITTREDLVLAEGFLREVTG